MEQQINILAFKPTHVIFHYKCNDGFTAAAFIKDYFTSFNVVNVEFVPMFAGTTPKTILDEKNKRLLFLDACPSKAECEKLMEFNDVLVIDHHKNAVDAIVDVVGPERVYFNNGLCGTELVNRLTSMHLERFLKIATLVGHKDLNRKIENEQEKMEAEYLFHGISSVMESHARFSTPLLDLLLKEFEDLNLLMETGKKLHEENEKYIEEKTAQYITIPNTNYYRGVLCLLPSFKCCTQIGLKLLTHGDFALSSWYEKRGEGDESKLHLIGSIRTSNGKAADIAKHVASLFVGATGNGHDNAAGFAVPVDKEMNLKELAYLYGTILSEYDVLKLSTGKRYKLMTEDKKPIEFKYQVVVKDDYFNTERKMLSRYSLIKD